MEKIDARKLPVDVQQQLRNQVIRLRKAGRKYPEIGEIVGIHKTTACTIYKKYEREGRSAIRIKKRGIKVGTHRTLTKSQETEIQKMIVDKSPEQLKLSFALWTRRAIQELIMRTYSINMPIRTVGEYLSRWGYTPQKPLKKAYEQNPKAVQKWLDESYSLIKAKAKKVGAEIHWGDETGLRSDSQHGRSFAPKGKTPVIRLNAKRVSLSLVSTITNQGKVRFMTYSGGMNAQVLIRFLKRVIKDAKRKVFLILDNLRVHHSKVFKEWVSSNLKSIEVFYLPSYSPELNPDEYLNCDLKAGVHSKKPARNKEQLKKKTISHLKMLQKSPERIKKYFKHAKIAYAA